MKVFLGILLLRDVPFWTATSFRRWMRRLAALACLYVGILLMLLWLENRFLYAGWSFGKEWRAAPAGAEDVRLTMDDGTEIEGRWFAPQGWTPADGAILYSHGNGGNHSWFNEDACLWQKRFRFGILFYDYPGYGRSGGRPSEAGLYGAGETAYRWLREEKEVAGRDLVQVGQSLGGAVAIELAKRHECRAVVTMGAFTSFPDMAHQRFPWLPVRWLVRNRFDNLGKIGELPMPVFIEHGTADGTVPFWQGERLAAAAPPGSRFFPIEGGPHAPPKSEAFFAAVKEWLGKR